MENKINYLENGATKFKGHSKKEGRYDIKMKAITIKQPWATLIAVGEKKFETRSWKTAHRGQLAIHAGKSIDKDAYEEFEDVLKRHGYNSIKDLPTGVVLATVDLIECHQVIEDKFPIMYQAKTDKGATIHKTEYLYGDFSKGRYGWELMNVQVFDTPVVAKGQLSLWNWEEE